MNIKYYLKCETVCFNCRKVLKEFEGPARTVIWDLCNDCWNEFETMGMIPNNPVIVQDKEKPNE